ncbi:MAG TPA: ATP-dependent Clp protease adaptor ClpS [Fimbriiglobus sp.]|nr:ATP-dependent Clp protease adaptor ClpS [Fimbriiglobus sp.]
MLIFYGLLLMLFAVLAYVAGLPAIGLIPHDSAIFLAVSLAFAGVVFWVICAVVRPPGTGCEGGGERPVAVVEPDDTPGPRYSVVILNDENHSDVYVIELLRRVFGLSLDRAWELMRAIDTEGRAVVFTGSLEAARRKQEQVLASGPDPHIPNSGLLRVLVEEVD